VRAHPIFSSSHHTSIKTSLKFASSTLPFTAFTSSNSPLKRPRNRLWINMFSALVVATTAVFVTSVAGQASSTVSPSMPPSATQAFNIAPIGQQQRCKHFIYRPQLKFVDLTCSSILPCPDQQLPVDLRWFSYGEYLPTGTLLLTAIDWSCGISLADNDI
jgi:hypothetical protein